MVRNRKKAAMGLVFVGLFLLCQFLVAGVLGPWMGIWLAAKSLFDGDFVPPSFDTEDVFEYSFSLMDSWRNELTGFVVVITLLSSMAFLGAMLLWAYTAGEKNPLEKVELRKMDQHYWYLCFLLGLGLNMIFSIGLTALPLPETWYEAQEANSIGFDKNSIALYAVAVAFLVPIAEEVCFRGLCYRYFSLGMSRTLAILLSSLIFGICHGSLLALFYTVPLAVIMCLVYDRCHSLWANIMIHAGFNFGSVLLGLLSEDTPEGTAIALLISGCIVALAAGAFLILRIRKNQVPVAAYSAPFPQAVPYAPISGPVYGAAPYAPPPQNSIIQNGENTNVRR